MFPVKGESERGGKSDRNEQDSRSGCICVCNREFGLLLERECHLEKNIRKKCCKLGERETWIDF